MMTRLLDSDGSESLVQFDSYQDAEEYIKDQEIKTCTKYVCLARTKYAKLTDIKSTDGFVIKFEDGRGEIPIAFDGVPFIQLGSEVRECHQGPDRKATAKTKKRSSSVYEDDHQYMENTRKNRALQATKKLGCPAQIKLRMIVRFPSFQIEPSSSETQKKRAGRKLRQEFDFQSTVQQLCVLVKFCGIHCGHDYGEGSAYIQPIDRRIIAKIYTLVDDGIVSTSQIQSYIQAFANTLTSNPKGRRFVPSDQDVRNHVFQAKKTPRWRTDHFIDEPLKQSLKTKYPEDKSSHIEWLLRDSTHPSVRIKGTETSYLPVQCFDPVCADRAPHMHCPFCVKTEAYTDPVILKAHYRVKHVDKGIEFAGLKVLRCCDRCDIVGVIKGEKKFKGAHWHCYKCRNGFNRRDEAIKHYKTHFRNPQTTFQIQIAQDINQPVTPAFETEEAAACIPTDSFSVHASLTDNVSNQPGSLTMLARGLEGMVAMPGVGAMETVGMADTQTIMIIQDDSVMQELCTSQEQDSTDLTINDEVDTTDHDTIQELREQISRLEKEKDEQAIHIALLNRKIEEQAEHIAAYKAREQGLLEQLHKMEQTVTVPPDRAIQELCSQLETQHKHLIQQQITQLKHSLIPTAITQPKMLVLNTNTHLGQTVLHAFDANSNCTTPVTVALSFATPPIVNDVNAGHVISEVRTEHLVDDSKDEDVIDNDNSREEHFAKDAEYPEILDENLDDELDADNPIIENDGSIIIEPPVKRRKGKL